MEPIIRKAHAVWESFTKVGNRHRAETVFASISQHQPVLMREELYRLAKFLCKAIIPGIQPVNVRIQYSELGERRPEFLNNRAASWLHCTRNGNSDEVTIIVDIEQIRSFLRQASAEGMEVYYVAMLILHELGHIFHFESLRSEGGQAVDATGEQESEAWLFATTFAGLWLADAAKAKKNRRDSVVMLPPAWQLLGLRSV